jgi:hypothetical protein
VGNFPFRAHNIIVRGWDSTWAFENSNLTLTASGTVMPTPPGSAVTVSNIDDDTFAATYYSGWSSCTTCGGGPGTNKTISFLQNQSSPVKAPTQWNIKAPLHVATDCDPVAGLQYQLDTRTARGKLLLEGAV